MSATAEDRHMKNHLPEKGSGELTIEEIKRTTRPIFERRGVSRALLFGSYARGEQTESSDVDIAIDEGCVRGLAFFSLQAELSDALKKEVDLQSLNASNETFVSTVKREGVEIFIA